mmetsp:Transcript_8992/g.18354  ORF Transcript_8992/g.18354 Transcript_8992/m.18354 type:complete len:273 (-) Transcript_8992:159-977(-)
MNLSKVALVSIVSGLAASIVAGDATSTNGDGDSLTACNGDEYSLHTHELNDSRDYLYCELIFNYPGECGGDVYSTSPLAPCDLDWWANLDLKAVAAERGAESVTKNGPQRWSMDTVTEKVTEGTDVGGAQMVYGANLAPGTATLPSYEVFYPSKTQYLLWMAGLPTYQLTDADGYNYVIQGYKVETSELATLGDQFEELPEGWSYNVITPDEDLILDLTPETGAPSVIDEFDQVYIRIPEDDTGVDDPDDAGHKNAVTACIFGVLLFVPLLL